MRALRHAFLLIAGIPSLLAAQSFVNDYGGSLAQDGVGVVQSPGGFAVAVRDIAPAREALAHAEGLAVCDSPAAAAEGARAAIVAVVDAAQTEDVLFGAQGLAAALPRGAAVLLCPTIAPHDTERFAARLAEAGLEAIDAPMSGGPLRAREGTMSLMVACAASSFERQRDLIEALSGAVFRLGERLGDGARMKLVNNLLAGINLAGAAEVLALAHEWGERRGLGKPLGESSEARDGLALASAVYNVRGDFVQLWFLTNGRALVQASYVCPWADREAERAPREAIMASLHFA